MLIGREIIGGPWHWISLALCAGGGTRTRTGRSPMVFETIMNTNSITPACDNSSRINGQRACLGLWAYLQV